MKLVRAKIFLLFLLQLIFFNSCKDAFDDLDDSDVTSYYIDIGHFQTLNSAKNYKVNLDSAITKVAVIQKLGDKSYRVLLGKYVSSYLAGKAAYTWYSKKLISDYSINKRSRKVLDEFRNVLFVANYEGRPSVYNLDLLTKRIEPFWSRWGNRVIALNPSDDRRFAFITTALTYGQRGGLPYILDVRVLHLDRDRNEFEEISQLGDAVQLYTYWETPDTFKVNVSNIDTINSRNVYQKIFPFELSGKQHKIVNRKFDVLANGFPSAPKRNPVYFSPNNRFQLREAVFRNEYNFYIRDIRDKSEVLVSTSKRKIADAHWSEDGNYLFILTQHVSHSYSRRRGELTNELIVIDAVQKKQVNIFSEFKYGNILVQGNFILFDERSSGNSSINVLDYVNNKMYYTISLPGGCGLNNLPLMK